MVSIVLADATYSWRTGIPADCNISGLPMPDSSRRCGDFHRTIAKDHLAAAPRLVHLSALHISDPDGAPAVEEDTGGERIGLDAQIGAAPRRVQKGARRRPASAIFLVA